MTRQIILDTETTGLDPRDGHRIIEIGCIEMVKRRLTNRTFHVYINPEREIDAGAQNVHGLSNEFLADKPRFADIVDDFIHFVDGAELVIHNAPFDVGFLNHEFRLLNRGLGRLEDCCTILDTLAMARKMHPGQRNSLDALCKRYGVDNSGRNLHGALIDADLLASMYIAMTSGQDSLFSNIEQQEKEATTKAGHDVIFEKGTTHHLPIIKASTEELAAHEEKLEAMQAAGVEVLWRQ